MAAACSILIGALLRIFVIFLALFVFSNALQNNIGKGLYMRGNSLGFSWQRGITLNKTGSDTWRADIMYQSAVDGFRCQNCADNRSFTGEFFEYRIYVDDTVDMMGGNFQLRLPISQTSSYFSDTPVFHAYPWFFSKEGSASVIPIASSQIGNNRSILLYRPPSFYENTYKTYPTVIAFDVEEEAYNISAHLINAPIVEKQTVAEYMMVGFGDYPLSERADLLTPVYNMGFRCKNGSIENRCNGCMNTNYSNYMEFMTDSFKCGKQIREGGRGNDTLDFLIQTVLPKLKTLTVNRMLTDQPNLGIFGYSLGGLMACHAAWTRPQVFGFAACQSPAFWWPTPTNPTTTTFFFTNVSLQDSNLRSDRPYQRIYLDVGGSELSALMKEPLVYVGQELVSTGKFEMNQNLWVDIYPGDRHNFPTWMSRIWNPLKIFLPTKPAPRQDGQTVTQCTTQIAPIPVG